MSLPDEFKEKKNISMGLLFWVAVIAFNIGVLYATMLGTKEDVVDDKKAAKDYTEQEVGGLRSDWERQNAIAKEEREQLQADIKELEKYHKEK